MVKTMGMSALLILSVLVALSGARPQNHREVKLITEPRPGQEFVMIQSSVFKPQKQAEKPEQAFVTSHKIPGKIPEDDPEDLIVKKIKRESEILPADQAVDFLLTPDQTLALAAETPEQEPKTSGKVEVRTEFSVVTSKPRKGGKAIAFSAKESVPSPTAQVPLPEVNVETKGETGKLEAALSGDDEKKVMLKKLSTVEHVTKVPVKDEPTLKQVEVKVASELGVSSPQVEKEEGAITVPLQKKQGVSPPEEEVAPEVSTTTPLSNPAVPGYEILPVNILPKTAEKVKHKDKDFDFVDSPLADKVLVPAAGSNQQSRIEVKKGPNGQDYEYEYVYYYYDDDENDASGGSGSKKTAGAKGSSSSSSTETTTSSRHYLPKKESVEDTPAASTRGRTRGQAASSEEKHEEKAAGKTRYTSIDRTTTTAPDAANEVLPTRGAGSRTRGRTLTTEEPSVSDERLPVNTRFPPRSRSNHNSNSVASTTPLPQDTPTRSRGSSNSVRRPSLELVDSSSFKTQSSDASRDQDPRPEFPKTLPAGPVRFLGVTANEEEEVIKPRGRGRGQASTTPAAPAPVSEEQDEEEEDTSVESHSRGQLSRRPDTAVRTRGQAVEDENEEDVSIPQSVTELPEDDQSLTTVTDAEMGLTAAAMDKAALELYAVLSQARAESNSIDEESTGLTTDEDTTELDDLSTTPEPTTEAPTTTTTTTTTPAPTTTTTTTTEAPAPAGRGRYRQRGGSGTRNRFRGGSDSSTTTSTEAPAETSTKGRARFGANKASSPRRSSFQKPSPARSEEESAEHEVHKEEAKSDTASPTHHRAGGFSRNRFGAARTPKVTTPSSSSDDSHATTNTASAPANKPVFADRFNLRRRGGLKPATTAAPAAEETKGDGSEETNEPPAEPSTTAAPAGRLPGRGRLAVGSGPRPLRPGPRVNIAPRGRLGAATTTTTAAPSTEAEESANEQTSAASQEEGQSEEAQEVVTTPAPDALTRLRNRPRLRVNNVKPVPASTAAPIRRSPLISRRKLGGHPAEVKESAETEAQDASSEDTPASNEETSEGGGEEASSPAPAEPEQPQGLASLVSGRRRGNALRRPRTLLPGGGRVAAKLV